MSINFGLLSHRCGIRRMARHSVFVRGLHQLAIEKRAFDKALRQLDQALKEKHRCNSVSFRLSRILSDGAHMQNLESIDLKDTTLLRTKAFVAGEWQGAASGATFEVRNPATGQVLSTVPKMGA